MLSLEDAWIKAAVEHKTLEINYFSGKTKGELTVREVEPDFYGWSTNNRNFGCWGFCRLRNETRCFVPDNVQSWRYLGNEFHPNPIGRWQELLSIYEQRELAQATYE